MSDHESVVDEDPFGVVRFLGVDEPEEWFEELSSAAGHLMKAAAPHVMRARICMYMFGGIQLWASMQGTIDGNGNLSVTVAWEMPRELPGAVRAD